MWHKKWLRYSPQNTPADELLQQACKKYSLKEVVQAPTRDGNLLDLVLTNLPEKSSTTLLPALVDHRGVLTTVTVPTPLETTVRRTVWLYKKASWKNLKKALAQTHWEELLKGDAHQATAQFTEHFLSTAQQFVC